MHNFQRTDEQRLLGENLRRFLKDRNGFETRRKRLGADAPDRLALWPQLAEMGVLGAAFGESAGGFAGDPRSLAVILYEWGRALAIEPFLGCAVVGQLLQCSTDPQASRQAIEPIIAGERVIVLAHDAGADPFALPLLAAQPNDGYIVLEGSVNCVRHADVAHEFLVSVRASGGVAGGDAGATSVGAAKDRAALLRIPRSAPGLSISAYRLMDGAGAADLCFDKVRVERQSLWATPEPALAALGAALEWGILGLVAETCGIADALNEATFAYLMTRKQFGVVLGSFQALQHRCADMFIAAEELTALAELAIAALAEPASSRRSALLAAAKSAADIAGTLIGHEAIQLHGGMGVSDELNVSHYARRLAVIRTELGSVTTQRLRFWTMTGDPGAGDRDVGGLLALQDDEDTLAWRAEVRDFVARRLPADIARKGALGLKLEKDDFVRWQKILHEQHWFAGAWPKPFGGQGWGLLKQLMFARESALCNAPWIPPYGVNMVGPVIYTYGSDEQKRFHLPRILSSEIWWCQGYSEPGSGSDLASLKTVARLEGDMYVVNGAKMWTTEAHWADWMHCLVRTDSAAKPQAGISFLLIDMKTPGIEIKPIVTIDGVHHTNAVFLDNVRVPAQNRVGAEGQGWGIAKFLLANERTSVADTGAKLRLLGDVQRLCETFIADPKAPEAVKNVMTVKMAEVSVQLLTLCALERSYVDAWSRGEAAGAAASVLKIRGTEILQAITELALELEGSRAAAYDPADLFRALRRAIFNPAQRASHLGYEYLYGRCWSIFGGTNEVQRNIISRQILSP